MRPCRAGEESGREGERREEGESWLLVGRWEEPGRESWLLNPREEGRTALLRLWDLPNVGGRGAARAWFGGGTLFPLGEGRGEGVVRAEPGRAPALLPLLQRRTRNLDEMLI